MVVVAPSDVDSVEACACSQSSLPRSPLLSMSSAITAASRASPSMTGQMGWSFPEMVKPAAVILLLKLVRRTRGGVKICHPCPGGPLLCSPWEIRPLRARCDSGSHLLPLRASSRDCKVPHGCQQRVNTHTTHSQRAPSCSPTPPGARGEQRHGPSPLGLGGHGLGDGVALHEQVQGLGGAAHHGGGQAVGEEVRAGALAEQIDEGFGARRVPTCGGREEEWARHPWSCGRVPNRASCHQQDKESMRLLFLDR